MDNALHVWMEQKAHITIEDDNDTYTARGVLTSDCFLMSLSDVTSASGEQIAEEIRDRIRNLIQESNKENTFQIKIED